MPGLEPNYLLHWLPGQLLTGIGVGLALPSLSGAAVAASTTGDFFLKKLNMGGCF